MPLNTVKSELHAFPTVSTDMPRHEKYYFEDRLVVFQVDGQLYRVHRYTLATESPEFEKTYLLPKERDGILPGSSDARPVHLKDTSREEFEALLDFLYTGMHRDYAPDSKTWLALLSIAHRYTFQKIHVRAIYELKPHPVMDPLDPIQRIILACRFNISDWLMPAYIKAVRKEAPPTFAEAEVLGMKTVVMLMRVRDTMSRGRSTGRNSLESLIKDEIKIMEGGNGPELEATSSKRKRDASVSSSSDEDGQLVLKNLPKLVEPHRKPTNIVPQTIRIASTVLR